jgi:metal-dependent amidase/aminoacylase/carboxypeptidase family protein
VTTDVVALRRDLHAHPEIAFTEQRTTNVIVEQLESAGLSPKVLPGGTGAVCDIGTSGPIVAVDGGRSAQGRDPEATTLHR